MSVNTTNFRAKVKLIETTVNAHNISARKFRFVAEYDHKIPEDLQYCKYTPSAEFVMTIDNPFLVANLIPGDTYYVDFTKVEK